MRGPPPALPASPLPIAVLTGFLGSGKTTFLSRVLTSPGMSDTAVVINEFGAVGLDHLLVEAAPDQDVVELPNGCVCCAVRQDLAETLYGLLRRRASGAIRPFNRIVLETSGLAEPSPILYTLSADAFLEASLHIVAVVTVIDSVLGQSTLDRFPEATAQAASADVLLLSKTDLATPSASFLARLESLNPAARLRNAIADEPTGVLFDGGDTAVPGRRFSSDAIHAHGIRSYVVVLRRRMTRLGFAMALGGLARAHGEDLLRVKGLVGFADREGGPAAIHAVQHTMYPPRWLDAWPAADTTSRLVFIVRGLDAATLLTHFADGEPILSRNDNEGEG